MASSRWQLWPGEGWGPLKLGLTRQTLLAELAVSGAQVETEEDDPEYLSIDDVEFELLLSDEEDDADSVIQQISTEDDAWELNGQPIVGERLDKVLAPLGIAHLADTVWMLYADPWGELYSAAKLESAGSHSDREPEVLRDKTASAEKLLDEGVLWSPSQGLGIQMRQGLVNAILLRSREHVPRRGYGPLTSDHLELAQAEDLEARLQRAARGRGVWPMRIVTALFALALGAIVYTGYQHQQRLMAQPPVSGKVVEVENRGSSRERYVIAYQDQTGREHEARWTTADTLVLREVGDTVDVVFLPESPEEPIGPAGTREFWFLYYLPHVLAAFAGYAIAMTLLAWRSKP